MFLILATVALFSVASYAAPVPCGGAQDVLAGGFSCEFQGLLFSNFSATDAGGVGTPSMILVSAALVGSEVTLNFNPNLSVVGGSSGASKDLYFYYQISGGIFGIDLAVGGTGASIDERACSTAIDTNAGNTCTGGVGNQLGTLSVVSGNADRMLFSPLAPVSPVYVFKDILVQAPANGTAHLSTFSQSYAIPEPVTMALFGSGLLVLGLVRRFRRR
jgi:hypothetical protein